MSAEAPGDSEQVTLADVERAAAAIAGQVVRTPSALSETLSEVTGATVVVKFENLQFTASFKERGALNCLLHLTPAQQRAGVVAVSAGNHAQAVAHHARRLGIDAVIVMPATTPFVKVTRTQHLGATVLLRGETLTEALAVGDELVAEGRTAIHPFDDPRVIAGQGTVALEFLADHPDLDALLVPVGGGGLVAGMAVVTRALQPNVEIVGVETEQYPALADLVHGRAGAPIPAGSTMAEGIAVPTPGRVTSAIVARLVDDVVTVPEAAIEDGVNLFLEIEKVVSEGAGAAGLAALLVHADRFRGRRVGVVLTGGNIDPRLLASVVMRGLVHSGRMVQLRVTVDDRPGSLSALTHVVAEAGGNIVEVVHQRLFVDLPIRTTEIELAVETLDAAHADRLVSALIAAGYGVTRYHAVEPRPEAQ